MKRRSEREKEERGKEIGEEREKGREKRRRRTEGGSTMATDWRSASSVVRYAERSLSRRSAPCYEFLLFYAARIQ